VPTGARLSHLTAAAIAGSVIVLPFVILDWVNTRFGDGFPLVLFALMWLLASFFVLVLRPLVRKPSVWAARPSLLSVLPRIATLIFIAWMWVAVVLDQMPCFLGVPNCD
jgi:hypothetical protein